MYLTGNLHNVGIIFTKGMMPMLRVECQTGLLVSRSS
jgi:membrane glycosyltransferase